MESYPHHRGPLDVVGLGEGRPPAAGTNVPDNDLDPMVTMVPIRGGRAAPPVKATISINPAASASALVWATVAVRAPGQSAADVSTPVWAAATTPLRVHGCLLRHQLELVVSIVINRNRVAGATGAQSLELCRRRTRCIHHRCCFYLCPCCCQFHHRQPCHHRSSFCHRSLTFLYRGNLGLLSVLRVQGDRALRLSFGHGALVGGCYVGKRLPQMSYCSSV
jgi:hypothetical protein